MAESLIHIEEGLLVESENLQKIVIPNGNQDKFIELVGDKLFHLLIEKVVGFKKARRFIGFSKIL